MTDPHPGLAALGALIGTWSTEATHPTIDGPVPGEATYEWAPGGRFLIQRSRNDHEHVPDAIAVFGVPEDGDGLVMEYFDSRGVRRTYRAEVADGELRLWRDDPQFAQRFRTALGGDRYEGVWQVATTPGDWRDDLRVVATRRPGDVGQDLDLFAGLPVRDFAAARPWYERLLGEATFVPHATEAVWTVADRRSVYVVQEPERAGGGAVTVFVSDLDAAVAAIAARGLEPVARETYGNGVRKVLYRDADGNEVGFGGAPASG